MYFDKEGIHFKKSLHIKKKYNWSGKGAERGVCKFFKIDTNASLMQETLSSTYTS